MRFAALAIPLALAVQSPSAHALTLVYSNDVLGELEPCGCRANPMGGMLRKAGLLEKLKSDGENQFLQVDAGDFLFDSTEIAPALVEQTKLQASYLLRAHEKIGHQIVVPGEKDFALGVKVFQSLTKKSKIRFLAANLEWNGKSLLPGTAEFTFPVKDGSPLKVAVLGIVGENIPFPDGIRVNPVEPVVKKFLEESKGKYDRLIVVSHQGHEKDLELAKKFEGIDVIVGAHSQSFHQEPVESGNTRIVQSSYRNQYVGVFPLDRGLFPKKHELVGLDEQYEKKPDATMKKIIGDFKSAIAKLNAKAERELKISEPVAKRTLQTFAQCVSCHEPQFDFWRKTNHARALSPLAAQSQLKNLECLKCHTVGLGQISGWKDLGGIGRLKNGESATTVWPIEDQETFLKQLTELKNLDQPIQLKRDSAPLPARQALDQIHASFAPVQCENCHGPAGNHPFSGQITRKSTEKTCVSCHSVEREPAWYRDGKLDQELFGKKLKSVACPSG